MLGRLAALAARPRPLLVHTFHGHVLEGYFSPRTSHALTQVERLLGRVSDRLVTVSTATSDDLVRLGVAAPERFETIPLGLPLEPFLAIKSGSGQAFRDELELEPGDVLATFTGRLVHIKRLDVLLEAIARVRAQGSAIVLAVVGDGPERTRCQQLAVRLGIGGSVRFLGFRDDVPTVLAGTDIAVLSSDNEGTPVSLIEAAAAGRPLISTAVGGVADVVPDGAGVLVPRRDPSAFGDALAALAGDPSRRLRMGAIARAHASTHFSADALVERTEGLYERLLAARYAV